MITHYYLSPYHNPYKLAEYIKCYSSLPVSNRHIKQHDEQLSDNCIIHYDFKLYSISQFLKQYYHEN